ncbi:MAG TPA: CBS domain-containing protein [Kofleriaceae bacterium]|nr:CBS domain-containing protein [Kofleriaceae bacterium]
MGIRTRAASRASRMCADDTAPAHTQVFTQAIRRSATGTQGMRDRSAPGLARSPSSDRPRASAGAITAIRWSSVCTPRYQHEREPRMRVQDLMSHPAITCHANDDLDVPAELMWDHDCGVILVVRDDGKLAGVITDRDICMAAYTQGRSLDQILVNAVMAMHVITARPDQDLGEVERLMVEHQVRRIPVVDDDEKPIGVLSLSDLALESVEPDTQLKEGGSRVAHALAAVCRPRIEKRIAA